MGSITTIATLALLVGAALASIGFKEGQEYEYKYYGKAVSGIPNLKNQFAGVLLNGNIRFQRQNANTVYMKIERLQAIEVNGPIPTGNTDKVFRDLQKDAQNTQSQTIQQTIELTQVAPELSHPVRVQYQNGKIHQFEVSRDVPEWAVNMQKGILSMVKLNIHNLEQTQADYEQINRLNKEERQDAFVNYHLMEEDVTGDCQSTYSISSQPWEAKPQESVLNITKIRNFEVCNNRPQFVFQTVQEQDCPNCKASKPNVLNQLATVQYNLRGNRQSYEFERIETQGQMLYTPFTAEADYLLTNHSQVLVIRNKQQIQAHLQLTNQAKTHQSLLFRLPAQHQLDQVNNGQFDLRKAPATPLFHHQNNKKVSAQQVAQLIKEISHEIKTVEEQQNPQVLAKTLAAKRLMRMLDMNEVEQCYQECAQSDNHVAKRVCQDVMVMAGTSPCIMVLKKAIESELIHGEEAALILQQIPTTILTPHYTLIEEFKTIAKSAAAQRDSQIWTTAMLSYGTLVGIACNGTANTRETPSYIHKNKYCPTEMKEKFMRDLQHELRNTNQHWRKIVIVLSIGNTMAPEAVEILKPYISGQATDCPVLRSKAIHALTGAAKVQPRKVVKVLSPIFFNQQEMTEVRAAALSVLITARPAHLLAEIAASTWTETSHQMGSFVCSTLKNLAHADAPCLRDLKNQAKQAYELCNQDFEGNLLDSKNVLLDDDKMKEYNMFNTLRAAWINSNESIIPTDMYAKMNRTVGGFNFNSFLVHLNQKGLDEVLNRIAGPKSAFYNMRSLSDLLKKETNEQHKGFTQLVQQLNIDTQSRQTTDLLLNLYVKFFDTQARNFHISKETVNNFISGNTQSVAAKYFNQLVFGPGLNLDYQKIFNQKEAMFQVATPLGLSVATHFDDVVFVSVHGHINVDVDASRNPNSVVPTNVRLSANIRPVVISKKQTTMGVILPFEQKKAMAGVTTKTIIAIPINGQMNIDLSQGKMTVVAGRSQHQRSQQGSNQLPVYQFTVKPFTCVARYTEAKPFANQQNTKRITVQHQTKQFEKVYLAKSLGLPVVLKVKTQEQFTSQSAFVDRVAKHGIWNLINFFNVPQSFKTREYTVQLRTESADTKEVEAVVEFEFTPSKLQRELTQGQLTPSAIWSFIAGWSDLPMPCKKAGQLNSNQYEQEERNGNEFGSEERNQYGQDDEECNGDDEECNQNRKSTSNNNRNNFWNNWQQNQDKLESSTEFESQEYNNGRWSELRQRNSRPMRYLTKNAERSQGYESNKNCVSDDDEECNQYSNKQYNQERNQYNNQYNGEQNSNVHKVNIADNVPAWKVVIKVKTVGGQERSLLAVISGKRNFAQLKDSIKAEVKVNSPALNNNQIQICGDFVAQYPSLPCSYDHSFQPNTVGPIQIEAKTTWGHNGCQQNNFIHMETKVGKSRQQLEYETEAKPWFYKQCREERSKGLKFNEACSTLYDKVTALNKIDMKIKYNNLPLALKNATHKVDNLLKHVLYNHMSEDAVTGQNQHNQLRIVAEFLPNKKACNVKIEKPQETTIFTDVKTKCQAPSAHRTIAQQVADKLTGRQLPATCDISASKYVNTFNNMTYKHEMHQCTYLATKDCSPNGLFAVLISAHNNNGQQAQNQPINCIVHLLKNQIKLSPLTQSLDKYRVEINGKQHELNQGEVIIVESGKQAPGTPDALAYITLAGHFVHVKAPAHGIQIKYDGKDVRVEASNFWNGKLCGLCGNFDGETQDELVGPNGCVFARANDFAQSYIVSNGQCQQKQHNAQKLCKDNKQVSKAIYPQLETSESNQYRSGKYENDSENENNQERRQNRNNSNKNWELNSEDDDDQTNWNRRNENESESERQMRNQRRGSNMNNQDDDEQVESRRRGNNQEDDEVQYETRRRGNNQDDEDFESRRRGGNNQDDEEFESRRRSNNNQEDDEQYETRRNGNNQNDDEEFESRRRGGNNQDDDEETFESRRRGYNNYKNNNNEEDSCTIYRNKMIKGQSATTQRSGSKYSFTNRNGGLLSYFSFENNNADNSQENDSDETDAFQMNKEGQEQMCFSVEALPKCKPGCQAASRQIRNVRYHCLNANQREARQLARQQNHRQLDLEGKRVDSTQQESIPTACVRAY